MRHNFKNLKVWEKAMDLADKAFEYCKDLPANERYNLIDQINRCSCSVPSNIAEGSGKNTNKHFAEFLAISISSSFELETQLLIWNEGIMDQKINYRNVYRYYLKFNGCFFHFVNEY